MSELWRRSWTEISLDNLIHNYSVVRESLPADVKICCVVKANAYGHHAPVVASVLERQGVDMFAVSNIEEALQLRNSQISVPILILGYTPPNCSKLLIEKNISQCVYSLEYAEHLCSYVKDCDKAINIHIKIDTGMGRLGFQLDDSLSCVEQINKLTYYKELNVEGIFTHFAVSDCGDSGKHFTAKQYSEFINVVNALENKGISFKYKHCANSAAAMAYPQFRMTMVRAGIILYGLLPSDKMGFNNIFKPVMSLKTVISHIKEINAGDTLSYGCDFIADKKMKIATVPMGYADGFWRANGRQDIPLFVRGKGAPIVGRICMDQLMIDVTDIEDVCLYDEVTVFGGENCGNSANTFAEANNTINYEIICSVGKRVPRAFILNGETNSIHLGLLDTSVN